MTKQAIKSKIELVQIRMNAMSGSTPLKVKVAAKKELRELQSLLAKA